MTSTKFTAGPWKVHPYLVHGPHCMYRDVGPGLRAVCNVIGKFENGPEIGDEQEANARLIAAAPELFWALRNMVECFGSPDGVNQDIWLEQARDAIRKAEG